MTNQTTKTPNGTGCAVYASDSGPLVFLSPRAAELPERDQADLLRTAARALSLEAARRERPAGWARRR